MVGGRTERGSRRHARAASVVVPFPRATGGRLDLARLVPSGRSLAAVVAVLLAAAAAYWGAYSSPLFAVADVEVRGAPPEVAREVEQAVSGYLGQSLVAVDAAAVEGSVRALPSIAGASVDRAFPSTLVVKVAPERAVGVARRGDSAWLVTGSGDVIRTIETGTELHLPRLWLPKGTKVRMGGTLPVAFAPTTRALEAALDEGLARRVKGVRWAGGELTYAARIGPEIRLGRPVDLRLKAAVAARVLPLLGEHATYLDVSVPERPVSDG